MKGKFRIILYVELDDKNELGSFLSSLSTMEYGDSINSIDNIERMDF